MTDEIIVGIFTLLGTILGFCLTKLSDFITTKREKRRSQLIFTAKLVLIQQIITNVKTTTEKSEKITNQNELKKVLGIMTGSNLKNEFSKLEPLYERSITLNFKKIDVYGDFMALSMAINNLLSLYNFTSDDFVDIKPEVLRITSEILKIIDTMTTQMYYEYIS